MHDDHVSFDQLATRRDTARLKATAHRFEKHDARRKCANLTKKMSLTKQIFTLLATQDVPRLQQLLALCFRQGWGMQGILLKIGAAAQGLYKAAQYSKTDVDVATLVLRLGGRKLLFTLSKTHGLCSKNTVRRLTDQPRFWCCADTVSAKAVIKRNITLFIFEREPPTERCLWVFAVDDVALDERLRFNPHQGKVLGLCREHIGDLGTSITGHDDLRRIKDRLVGGCVHLAKELTVGALMPIRSKNYQAQPVFASGTCKLHETAISLQPLYEAVIEVWYEDDRGYKLRGPIANINTDGAANFRLAAAKLLNVAPLDATVNEYHQSEMHRMLSPLVLFDTYCGVRDPSSDENKTKFCIVDSSDDKHSLKRWRMLCKSLARVIKVRHQLITGFQLRDCLERLGEDSQTLQPLFFPDDAQNVEACVRLCTAMDKHKDATVADIVNRGAPPPLYPEFLKEFRVISHISSCFVLLLGTQDKSISQHLTSLSKLSHILLVVYRRRGTSFCPAQTYENIQSFVVAHYKSVAQQKAEGAHEYYIFQDSDDRLENYFGVMRTLVAAQRGFDMLMAEDRIGATSEIARIYEDNPTWAPRQRRLNGSLDHHRPGRDWTGCIDPRNVTLGEWAPSAAVVLLIYTYTDLPLSTLCTWNPTTSRLLERRGNSG
jgi:hypothetical protein